MYSGLGDIFLNNYLHMSLYNKALITVARPYIIYSTASVV
jgi:hypothetical protein